MAYTHTMTTNRPPCCTLRLLGVLVLGIRHPTKNLDQFCPHAIILTSATLRAMEAEGTSVSHARRTSVNISLFMIYISSDYAGALTAAVLLFFVFVVANRCCWHLHTCTPFSLSKLSCPCQTTKLFCHQPLKAARHTTLRILRLKWACPWMSCWNTWPRSANASSRSSPPSRHVHV